MQGAFKSRLQLQTHEFNPTGVSQRQWGNTAATSPTRRARKLGSLSCSSHMASAQGCVCVGPPSAAVRGRKCSDRKSRYLPCGDGACQGLWAGHRQHLCGGGSERGTSRMIPGTTGWVVMPFRKTDFGGVVIWGREGDDYFSSDALSLGCHREASNWCKQLIDGIWNSEEGCGLETQIWASFG